MTPIKKSFNTVKLFEGYEVKRVLTENDEDGTHGKEVEICAYGLR